MQKVEPIRIGLVAGEPVRVEGLTSVFDHPPKPGQAPLVPVIGSLEELLENGVVDFLVVVLSATAGWLSALDEIRRLRPALRLIVIGPGDDEQLVMDAIIGGARAYLDVSAGTREVRDAIEAVTSGSIWAPRRLLSKLIDRLLKSFDGSLTNVFPHLTAREQEVLDLILTARSNREIARALGIEERTVKAHVSRLMRKTGAENRIDLSMKVLSGKALSGSLSAKEGFVEGRRRGWRAGDV